ncbi:MAG: GldG family protein, partial [Myxococcota bacterium]
MALTDPRQAAIRLEWVRTTSWLALFAVALHLLHGVYLRLDWTRDGRYALSDAARAVAARVEAPLVARVYVTERLDPPYHGHRAALLDLLAELDAAAGGRIEVVTRDPSVDPAARDEAQRNGVRGLPYAFRSADRTETRTVWLGVALQYRERSVAIDALPAVERMEYEVARAVAALTAPAADDRPGVGWWQGHGEPDLAAAPADSPLRELARRLGERVNLRPLPGGEPIPDDVDLVVIAAPRRPVPAADQWALDQFVMRGGRVLAFLSSFQADFERGAPVEVDHGLYALFGQYGITVGRDLLIDRQHAERLSIPMGGRWVSLPHPLAPSTTLLDRAVPAVRGLPKLVLPFASTLRPVDPPPDGVEVEVWARSDADSASVKGLVTLDPTLVQNGRLSSEVPGPHPVV